MNHLALFLKTANTILAFMDGRVLTKDGFVTKAKIRLEEPHWAINQEECREIIRVIDNADNYESDKVEYENKVD